MKLLDQLIDSAADDDQSLGGVLRKCLVLAYQLRNTELQDWLLGELNGYDKADELPDYRVVHCISKGLLLGSFGAAIAAQPLPLGVMKPEHRRAVEFAKMREPIGALIISPDADKNGHFAMDWPPDLTAMYQSRFIDGYALNRAYMEIPLTAVRGLAETVRTRVLHFALEIKQQLNDAETDSVENLSLDKVAHTVNNYIYGGQNVIGSTTRDITQVGSMAIAQGDITGLCAALASIGVDPAVTADLRAAVQADREQTPKNVPGERTMIWVRNTAASALKIGTEVAQKLLTNWVAQYLGLPPG